MEAGLMKEFNIRPN